MYRDEQKNINLSAPKNTITAICSVAMVLCLFFALSAKNDGLKNWSFVIALGGGMSALVNHQAGKYYENAALEQYQRKQQSNIDEIKLLTSKAQQAGLEMRRLSDECAHLKEQLQEIKELEAELDELQTQANSDRTTIAQLRLKVAQSPQLLAQSLQKYLTNFINERYWMLESACTNRINSVSHLIPIDLDEKLRQELNTEGTKAVNRLKSKLSLKKREHLQWATQLDGSSQIEQIETATQIIEETCALKVQLRNVLDLSNRFTVKLLAARQAEIVRLQNSYSKYIAENKELSADYLQTNSQNSEGVMQLAHEHDQLKELVVKLQAQIKEWKKPQLFCGAMPIPLAGNKVAEYYYQNYKIRLDCLNWKETALGFEIIYGFRHNTGITETELFANNSKQQLAAFCTALDGTFPELHFNYRECLLTLKVKLRSNPQAKSVETVEQDQLSFVIEPFDYLLKFVDKSYHIGLWAETGRGKTTAIANILGSMQAAMNGTARVRATIPKIDESTASLFPRKSANWVGKADSIFGLLEAALEVDFRIKKSEAAYSNGTSIPKFEPVLFFIDEINLIYSRWKKISEDDIEDVLQRFESTLSGERLTYFTEYMKLELLNYRNEFCKRLLLFVWQTGRSLCVKSLISGQNLQPGSLGLYKDDLNNCSYISWGNVLTTCLTYKALEHQLEEIKSKIKEIEATSNSPSASEKIKFVAAYFDTNKNYAFGYLPPPNHYKWSVKNAAKNHGELSGEGGELSGESEELSGEGGELSGESEVVGNGRLMLKASPDRIIKRFPEWLKLPPTYKNMSNEALGELWNSLPKNQDGSVQKMQAYEHFFGTTSKRRMQTFGRFIDFLGTEFGN